MCTARWKLQSWAGWFAGHKEAQQHKQCKMDEPRCWGRHCSSQIESETLGFQTNVTLCWGKAESVLFCWFILIPGCNGSCILQGRTQEPQRTLVLYSPAPKCVSYFAPIVKDWQKPWGTRFNVLLNFLELIRESCWFNLAVLVSAVTSFGLLQQDVLQKHGFFWPCWSGRYRWVYKYFSFCL